MELCGRVEAFRLLLLLLVVGPVLAQVRHPLPVLWMMPVSSGSGEENLTAGVGPAVRLALQDLKKQPAPLGNYEIQLQLLDSQVGVRPQSRSSEVHDGLKVWSRSHVSRYCPTTGGVFSSQFDLNQNCCLVQKKSLMILYFRNVFILQGYLVTSWSAADHTDLYQLILTWRGQHSTFYITQ